MTCPVTNEWMAWFAGIVEGEGYIGLSPRVCIHVSMTDEDVVRRVYEVAGCGTFSGPFKKGGAKDHWKPQWRWTIHYRDDVARLLMAIRPFLGKRRGFAADTAIEAIKKMPHRARTHGDIAHGTCAGYLMESLRKIPHCQPCKDACAARQRLYRSRSSGAESANV